MDRRALIVSAAAGAMLAACSGKGVAKSKADSKTDAAFAPAGAKALAAGQAFQAKNASQPGVMSLPSGLQYKVVREGPAGGIHPRPQDEVKVHYEGTLLDGTVFDSSYRSGMPVVFPLGRLIPGWIEGIQLMKPGDEFLMWVPPKLGYGDSDSGPIPANSTLAFRIELLGVLPHGDRGLG